MAMSEHWRDRNTGERKERTEWVDIVVFNEGLCKVVEQYVHKGSRLYVEGQLQTRKWQDQNGNDRYKTEVVLQGFNATLTLLDSKPQDDRSQPQERIDYAGVKSGRVPMQDNGLAGRGRPARVSSTSSFREELDDEIPF